MPDNPRRHGRPRIVDDAVATERVQLRCTPALRLELQRVASERGSAMTDVVREAINVYVRDYGEREVFPKRRR
jgi:hypothetical protein